jgi:hypothetical protein
LRIVEQARRAIGCLDVAICADLLDPGRVNIFERWESQTALEAFRRGTLTRNSAWPCSRCAFRSYDIADAGRVRGECGMDRPDGPCCDR